MSTNQNIEGLLYSPNVFVVLLASAFALFTIPDITVAILAPSKQWLYALLVMVPYLRFFVAVLGIWLFAGSRFMEVAKVLSSFDPTSDTLSGARKFLGVILALGFVLGSFVLWNLVWPQDEPSAAMWLFDNIRNKPFLLWMFVLAVLTVVPLVEELVFRRLLFVYLARFSKLSGNVWLANALQAALFALVHQDVDSFVPLFVAGFALGWVFWFSNSLWIAVLVHSLVNAVAALASMYG